jgi:hypothetical protein
VIFVATVQIIAFQGHTEIHSTVIVWFWLIISELGDRLNAESCGATDRSIV